MFKSLLQKGRTLCLLLLCIASSMAVTAQTRRTGRVIGSDDRQPVIGASVRIKGSNTGTVTDVNGNFALSLNTGDVIVVSYIGYRTINVTVSADGPINISLPSASTTLTDVIVTGYTSQRKKDIAGAVAVVDVGDAKKLPASSTDQILQGQAAGVTVTTGGAPGSPSSVLIRGISNFGNSQPLYVVDGVQTGSITDINPNDIESISILKDAGAAAIYGVSGGNGVVVVTTKRGKSGKSTLAYDAFYGTQVPKGGNVYDALDAHDQSVLTWNNDPTTGKALYPGGPGTVPTYGFQGPGTQGVYPNPLLPALTLSLSQYHFDAANPGNDFLIQKFNQGRTDWFHAIFKAEPEQYHTITASGANDKNTYFMSFGYLNDQGTEQFTYLKRYEARINTTFKINDYVRAGENLFINYKLSPVNPIGGFLNGNNGGYTNQQEGDPISYAYRQLPQIPVYDIGGNYGGTYDGPGGEPLGNSSNPLKVLSDYRNDAYKEWNIQGNAFLEADIFKHVTVRTAFGGNINNQYSRTIATNNYEDYEGHNTTNGTTEAANYYNNYNWTNTLHYTQIFGKNNVSFLAGYEQKEGNGRYLYASGTGLFSVDPNYVSLSNIPVGNGDVGQSAADQTVTTQSLFARLDYIYADKYILGATVRRDGYSGFFTGNNREYGTFPSVSLAWRISQEDFLKGVSWLNDLKLRASYGAAGNNSNALNAGLNNAYSTFSGSPGNGYYPIGGGNTLSQGFYFATTGNQKTSWETDKTLNFGIDASLFNHFDLSAEYYQKKISGLLFALPLPATAGGASFPIVNVGDVQNNGVDFALTYHGASGGFRYSVGANLTAYKNKITSIPGSAGYFDSDFQRAGNIVREQIGQPIGEFFGYKTDGFYSPADIANPAVPKYAGAVVGSFKYVDENHDGKIDATDRTFIGNPNPDFTYGLNLNASYKGFDFTMVLYGSQGNKDFHYTNYFTDFYPSFTGGKSNKALYNSYGSPELRGTPTLPIQTDANTLGTTATSSYFVENGSFLKAKVVQVGYNFAPAILKAIGVQRLHVYVQSTNLFTITKYTGLDPELLPGAGSQNELGVDAGAYPNNQRQYILGVNMSF